MPKLIDYPKVQNVTEDNMLIMDGNNGTKGILAKDLGRGLLNLVPSKDILDNIDISELEKGTMFKNTDILMISTDDGNKKTTLYDIFDLLDPIVTNEFRRNIWRGRNLGNAVTQEQYNEIGSSKFRGMFLGDFWYIGGIFWRIVDFNYWYKKGDIPCQTPHVVIMPDESLYGTFMNDTRTTQGAYVGSKMFTENLEQGRLIISGNFGSEHILKHREYFQNAVTNGIATGGAWITSTVDLPNEVMISGSYIITPDSVGSTIANRLTIDISQLRGMAASATLAEPLRQMYWLRDAVNTGDFAVMNSAGNISSYGANHNTGVRPVFGLCKQNLENL